MSMLYTVYVPMMASYSVSVNNSFVCYTVRKKEKWEHADVPHHGYSIDRKTENMFFMHASLHGPFSESTRFLHYSLAGTLHSKFQQNHCMHS